MGGSTCGGAGQPPCADRYRRGGQLQGQQIRARKFQNGGRTTRTTIQPRPRPNPAGRHSHNTAVTIPAPLGAGQNVVPHQHSLQNGTHQPGQYNSPHSHGMTATTTGTQHHTHSTLMAGSGHMHMAGNNQQSGHGHTVEWTAGASWGHQHRHSGIMSPSGQHTHAGGSAAYRRGGRVLNRKMKRGGRVRHLRS